MIKRLAGVLLAPIFLLHAEDFVINLDNNVKDDFEVIKIEDQLKKEILEEKLYFYKNAAKEETVSVPKRAIKDSQKDVASVKLSPNYVVTENKTISELLSIIGKMEGNVYILKNKDFLIKEGYRIYNTKDLIKLVRLVSNFEMVLEKTDIKNTYFVNLNLKEDIKTLSIEAKVDLNGLKTLLMSEYGIKLLIGKDLVNDKTKLHLFGTYTMVELLEDLEKQLDVWFNLKEKKLYLSKTKEVLFDVKRDGEFSIDFTKQSSASTGAEDGGAEASTGFTFKIEDYSAEKFLATLKENFPKVIFKKSYSGFVIADVTPAQYKDITNFFKNVESRHELVSGEIMLLNFSTNDGFKYDMNWSDFLLNLNMLKVGSNGTLFLDKMSNKLTNTEDSDLGFKFALGRKNGSDNTTLGFLQALSQIGQVSIVDKWTISTATGIPTGFTNYKKIPYYTIENQNQMLQTPTLGGQTDPLDPNNAFNPNMNTYKLRYALTGFKSTFRVNKTKDEGYVIDGAVDFSSITGWTQDANGSKAPSISGKSMRIYSELKELNKTIVIGGFKNLTKQEDSSRTPFLANVPLLGWFFKSDENEESEQEFILLIRLNSPTIMNEKQTNNSFKEFKDIDDIRTKAELERQEPLSKW